MPCQDWGAATLRMAPWSHFRFCLSDTTGLFVESSSSLGKSTDLTSTALGPMYTTPLLPVLLEEY